MLGKLLKYDFRSMGKQFAFIWPAALVMALLNRFTIGSLDSSDVTRELFSGVAMLVYVAILIALFVIALIFIIQRFYLGLLGDEGYLMFTLPVRPWQLIASKAICALVASTVSIIVALCSILLLVPGAMSELLGIFPEFFAALGREGGQGALLLTELLLAALVGGLAGFLQMYLAMAVGHLFGKNRIALSVVAYIAIQAALNTVFTAVLALLAPWMEDHIGPFLVRAMEGNTWAVLHGRLWLIILGTALIGAVFFLGTEYILRRKLNLECSRLKGPSGDLPTKKAAWGQGIPCPQAAYLLPVM